MKKKSNDMHKPNILQTVLWIKVLMAAYTMIV